MHYNVKGRGVGERLQEREGEGEKSCTCVRVFALRSAVRARACVVRARVFSACVRGHAQFQRAWLKRVCAPLRCALCSVVCSRAHQQAIQNTTPVQNSSSSSGCAPLSCRRQPTAGQTADPSSGSVARCDSGEPSQLNQPGMNASDSHAAALPATLRPLAHSASDVWHPISPGDALLHTCGR